MKPYKHYFINVEREIWEKKNVNFFDSFFDNVKKKNMKLKIINCV